MSEATLADHPNQFAEEFDLTSDWQHLQVFNEAERLLSGASSPEDIVIPPQSASMGEHLAARCARGRLGMLAVTEPTTIVFVTNLLGEENRLRPKSADNPFGEDSLRRKLDQTSWLLDGTQHSVEFAYISDRDPLGSDQVLDAQIRRLSPYIENTGIHVSRYYPGDDPDWAHRPDNDKGRAWNYGLHLESIGQLGELGSHDYVHVNDADLMANMTIIGEMLYAAKMNDWDFVQGNRKDPNSKLQKYEDRNGSGSGWYCYMSRSLASYLVRRGILDSQYPAKLLSHNAAMQVAKHATVDTHAVDTDWLGAALFEGLNIGFIPVAAVDSGDESVSLKVPFDVPQSEKTPAARMHGIITSQIEQLSKYPGLMTPQELAHAQRVADYYMNKVVPHDSAKPYAGLASIIESSIEGYKFPERPKTDFTPDKIPYEEFVDVTQLALAT